MHGVYFEKKQALEDPPPVSVAQTFGRNLVHQIHHDPVKVSGDRRDLLLKLRPSNLTE